MGCPLIGPQVKQLNRLLLQGNWAPPKARLLIQHPATKKGTWWFQQQRSQHWTFIILIIILNYTDSLKSAYEDTLKFVREMRGINVQSVWLVTTIFLTHHPLTTLTEMTDDRLSDEASTMSLKISNDLPVKCAFSWMTIYGDRARKNLRI